MTARPAPAPTITSELKQLLSRVKLGKTLDALPERLALAKNSKLADEVERRDRASATLRARKARLDPAMTIHTWNGDANVTYDQDIWAELTSLRFVDDARCTFVLGPVGVGKTHLAHALGRLAIARRHKVLAARADQLFNTLKAARLDNSHDEHIRRLTGIDLLILDDFALQPMDAVVEGESYPQRQRPTLTTPKGADR